MSTDYSGWSLDKLKREKTKLEKLIKREEVRDRKKALAELVATAKKNGFELHELVGAGKPAAGKIVSKKSKPRKKVLAKYRNPLNPSETWAGRGKKPRWVQECLDSGKSLEELSI